jgi:hypothetical protein
MSSPAPARLATAPRVSAQIRTHQPPELLLGRYQLTDRSAPHQQGNPALRARFRALNRFWCAHGKYQ